MCAKPIFNPSDRQHGIESKCDDKQKFASMKRTESEEKLRFQLEGDTQSETPCPLGSL